MTYYYFHKEASKTGEFLQWLQDRQILEKKNTEYPMTAFLSVLFKDNPSQVAQWITPHTSGKTKEVIVNALRLSGNNKMVQDVFKETSDISKHSIIPLSSLSPKNGSELDMMWSAFFASGNDQYVHKIINVLDENTPLTGNQTMDTLTRRAAEWSLGSNMLQHELVNRIVHKEIITRSGMVKQKLEEINFRTEKKIAESSFPNRDGEFSAMMIVTDKSALSEYEKPSNEGMQFKPVTKAKRGDILAIKIVFSGMALTNDLAGDVRFDMKILDPNGNIYDNSDQKGLLALATKVPMRFNIFDNGSFMMIRFELNDKLGKYSIVTTIRDNVGKKKISLRNDIELTEGNDQI